MYTLFFKNIFDFIFSLIGLIVFLPIIVIIFILLLFANKGKPLFYQSRPGKNEKVFKIIKFKTMNDKKDASGKLLSDTERLTPIGKFIRKTSLDEVLQLINVIKGDMSFVGPRPLLIRYLPYYTTEEKKRHSVKPGITGLAQISGRNTIGWDERLAKDIEYVNNISFFLDLKILITTFLNVIKSKDIAVDTNSVIVDFDELRKTKKKYLF